MAWICIGLCVVVGALSGQLIAFRTFPSSDTGQIIGLVGGALFLSPVYFVVFSFLGPAFGTIFLIIMLIVSVLALMVPYDPFLGTFH
jgi:hypothetical protein